MLEEQRLIERSRPAKYKVSVQRATQLQFFAGFVVAYLLDEAVSLQRRRPLFGHTTNGAKSP